MERPVKTSFIMYLPWLAFPRRAIVNVIVFSEPEIATLRQQFMRGIMRTRAREALWNCRGGVIETLQVKAF